MDSQQLEAILDRIERYAISKTGSIEREAEGADEFTTFFWGTKPANLTVDARWPDKSAIRLYDIDRQTPTDIKGSALACLPLPDGRVAISYYYSMKSAYDNGFLLFDPNAPDNSKTAHPKAIRPDSGAGYNKLAFDGRYLYSGVHYSGNNTDSNPLVLTRVDVNTQQVEFCDIPSEEKSLSDVLSPVYDGQQYIYYPVYSPRTISGGLVTYHPSGSVYRIDKNNFSWDTVTIRRWEGSTFPAFYNSFRIGEWIYLSSPRSQQGAGARAKIYRFRHRDFSESVEMESVDIGEASRYGGVYGMWGDENALYGVGGREGIASGDQTQKRAIRIDLSLEFGNPEAVSFLDLEDVDPRLGGGMSISGNDRHVYLATNVRSGRKGVSGKNIVFPRHRATNGTVVAIDRHNFSPSGVKFLEMEEIHPRFKNIYSIEATDSDVWTLSYTDGKGSYLSYLAKIPAL
jgi:hypothetical protein